MGKDAKDARREERKQRSEQDRQLREQHKRALRTRGRLFFVIGVLAAAGMVVLGVTRKRDANRVWSAEHGHWHDK